VSSRLARGTLGGLSVVLGGAALAMLPYVPGTPVKIALTTLGVALPSAIYVISNAVVGEITPAAQRGALLAIGTAVASSGGLLAPYIMGSVIESATTPLDGFQHRLPYMRGHYAGGRRHRHGARKSRARGKTAVAAAAAAYRV